jgi:hypothetical protein
MNLLGERFDEDEESRVIKEEWANKIKTTRSAASLSFSFLSDD